MQLLRFAMLAALTVAVSGCFGFQAGGASDFVPGKDFEPTGRTIHIKAAVEDLIMWQVYPGFHANMWGFCMAAADPSDKVSQDAIEYWPRLASDGRFGGQVSHAPLEEGGFGENGCSVPAPTLRVKQGDRVIVDLTNNHFHAHTIHWHGQHVPWKMDGAQGATQDSVPPDGSSFRYDFIAKRAGTLWYHCHVDVHFHVMQGLFGVIIVEPQDDRYEPKDIDKEYVFIYGTIRRELVQVTPLTANDPHINHRHKAGECGASGVQNCQNPPVDTTPDTWTLNGRSMPYTMADMEKSVIMVKEGERVRVRVLNAGETLITLHTHGHDMFVTHRDGNPIPPAARFWVDTLSIGPAERYDFVLEADNPGLWMMHDHIDAHVTNDHMSPGGAMTMIAYESTLEETGGDMMPFAAELPGGLPWIVPLNIPNDVVFGRDVNVANGPSTSQQNVNQPWSFPWELPCATRYVRVRVEVDPQSSSLQDLVESLNFQVRDPDGATIESSTKAIANGFAEWILDGRFNPLDDQTRKTATEAVRKTMVESLKPGAYTVSVTGTSSPATLRFYAEVDYHELESDLKAEAFLASLDLSKGTGLCSDAKRVFDPAA